MLAINNMMFAVFYEILHCLLLLETISAELMPGFYELLPDKRFSNVTTSISTPSAMTCCMMCDRTGTCSLVSYHKQSRTCELGSLRPGDDELIHTMTGWSLYYTVPWVCPPNWDQIGTSCYFIDTTLQSWTSAQVKCSVSGGHLLNVNTATENNDVINLFNNKYPGQGQMVWIGGQDVNQNETFYWTDGSLVSEGFEFWYSGRPNNWRGNENCMSLRPWNFKWEDIPCDHTIWSFCEKDMA